MKLHERYQQFRDQAVVKANIVRSVYASMALENQTVPMERLEVLYDKAERERLGVATPRTDKAGRG